jgi:hypothetical protein
LPKAAPDLFIAIPANHLPFLWKADGYYLFENAIPFTPGVFVSLSAIEELEFLKKHANK